MSASITGTFTIIDRASGPMRKMEAQAIKTMAAIEGVGKATDKAAGGNSATRKMETQNRVMKNTERQAKQTAKGMDELGGSQRRTDRSTSSLITKLGRLGGAFVGLKAIMAGLKFTAIIGAVGLLAQAIGVLVGGLVALVPALVQAGGAISALPGVISAAVQGFASIKLAMGGVGEAMKAGIALQKDAGQAAVDSSDQQRNAIHGVKQAEYSLMQSHRNVRDAQIQLTQARRDAVRNLTDLKLASQGAALGEQRATLTLREARQSLAQAAMNPGTTDMEMQGLRLGVSEAQLGVKQSRIDRNRAKTDMRRGVARGTSAKTNPSVRAANEGLQDAIHSQAEAAYALAEAQRSANKAMQSGGGPADAYKEALKQLSPEAQSFVKHLVSMRPAMKELRAEAGRELFPALEKALTKVGTALPMLGRVTRRTGGVLGAGVDRLAGRLTSRRRQGDIEELGKSNDRILNRMMAGVSNIAAALIDFMIAAQPFTDWLTHTIFEGTKWLATWARAGRETGSLGKKLEGVKERLKQFGRITSNVWATLRGIGRAAKPLGDLLWRGAERATAGWKRYVETVQGQRNMRTWFLKLYEPLHQLGQLTKDLAKAWARLTVQSSFTESVLALRRAVPSIEKLLTSSATLGPAAIDFLGQLAELFANLPLQPITMLLRVLTTLLGVVNLLVTKIPGLGMALSGFLLAGTLIKSGKMVAALTTKWRELFATIGMGSRRPPTAPGSPGTFQPFGLGGPAPAPGPGPMRSRWAGRAAGFGGGARALGGMAMMAGRAAGKFALPIAGLMAGMDFLGTPGTLAERGQAALSGATFGLLPGAETGAQSRARGQDAAMNVAGRGRGAVQQRMATLRENLNAKVERNFGGGRAGGRRGTVNKLSGDARERAQAQLNELRKLDEQMGRERTARLRAQSKEHGAALATGFGKAFAVYSKKYGPEQGMRETKRDMMRTMVGMKGSGRLVLAQNMVTWANTMKRNNPKLKGVMDDLTSSIKRKFERMGKRIEIVNGVILTGTKTEWKGIKEAMTDPAEKARQKVNAEFTKIQEKALGSLTAMGYTKSEARDLIKGLEVGGNAGKYAQNAINMGAGAYQTAGQRASHQMREDAKGARIPGSGVFDTVQVGPRDIAAPGELIANRHTENRVNQMLAPYGTTLGHEVAGETKPHWAYAEGGRVKPPRTGILGVPGVVGDRALQLMTDGANKRIDAAGAAGGPMGPVGPAGGPAGTVVPNASWNPLGKPVAKWIVPILNWAAKHGWSGSITSGYRSHAYNVSQGRNYFSNHESQQYPGGAIDVGGWGARAEGQALASVLAGYKGSRRLIWGGPTIGDWGHFSGKGNAKGGRMDWGGWNAKGGEFEVNRPTLFGAGEGHGKETVKISRGGKDGKSIHVEIHTVNWAKEGDLAAAIKREMELLADDLELA